MADIKKIQVDGVEYDIKDETARNSIGDLSKLTTNAKDSLVPAINEVAKLLGSGSGGASVQPDLAQNDETAADYVKNRAFYTDGEHEVTLCDATISTSEGYGYIIPWPLFETGVTYMVMFDGVAYEAVYDGKYLGNANLEGGYLGYELDDGELPFCVSSEGELGTNTAGDHTLKISCVMPLVHRIDPKYLPADYRPAVDIRRLVPADICHLGSKNSTVTYQQTAESWAETISMVEAVIAGKMIPYCADDNFYSLALTWMSERRNGFTMKWFTYDGSGTGLVDEAYTWKLRHTHHTASVQYKSSTGIVTLEHEVWRTDIPYSNAEIDAKIQEVAAGGGSGSCSIQRIESLDENNLKNLRDLTSGSYVLYGYFRPYAGSSNILPFDNLLVNVYRVDEGSHLFEFSTANSEVNFIEILVDDTADDGFAYARTPISMMDLFDLIAKVGNLDELTTTVKGSIVGAVNEVAAMARSGGAVEYVTNVDLPAANWQTAKEGQYYQDFEISAVTPTSRVTIGFDAAQLFILQDKVITFSAENEDGVVRIYATGDKPTLDYTVQINIKEVVWL